MEVSTQTYEASTSLLVCLFCDSKFSSHEELMLHSQIHNAVKPYLCLECGNRYAYKGALKRHVESHTKDKLTYNCDECDYVCVNKRSMTDHGIAHSSNKNFSCTKCDCKTISNRSLSKHIKENNHVNNFKCTECDSEFRFLKSLTKHANDVHNNKEPFACSICEKSFSKKYNLTKHMKIHKVHDNAINRDIENYHDAEMNQCDKYNNLENHVDELQNNCVSCKQS